MPEHCALMIFWLFSIAFGQQAEVPLYLYLSY